MADEVVDVPGGSNSNNYANGGGGVLGSFPCRSVLLACAFLLLHLFYREREGQGKIERGCRGVKLRDPHTTRVRVLSIKSVSLAHIGGRAPLKHNQIVEWVGG